jgi:putative nucleotidyltransferase with HDIG domain
LTLRWKGNLIEATSFRGEEGYEDGRHPGRVRFGVSLEEDLSRRDFTINAMAVDLRNGGIIDPFDGRKDLQRRLIRCVGNPVKRFSEDGLRSLRAIRFATALEFSIHRPTLKAAGMTLEVFRKVSAERVREEIMKMIKSRHPSRGLELMRKTGILREVLPELLSGVGMHQNRWHKRDVYRHSLKTMDDINGPPLLRLAGLLHDVGKPACIGGEGPDHTFYGHEKTGAAMTARIMERLRFSGEEISRVSHLVSIHMLSYSDEWRDGTVRRFVRRAGVENLMWYFELQRADILARGTHVKTSLKNLEHFQKRIESVLSAAPALNVKDLAVDGRDIMARLKLKPGPQVGRILSALLEKVTDNPELNTRSGLLKMAGRV